LAIFQSPDSTIPNGPDTQGYNPFTYAANDPMTRTDPSGHSISILLILALGPLDAAEIVCTQTTWYAPLLLYSEQVEATGENTLRPRWQ
jgi:hypothetical protein